MLVEVGEGDDIFIILFNTSRFVIVII